VCLDEEGFMQEIERFTKQQIPVQVVEGFAPEPTERAEPIAMGRQTLWGGAGKPPSREVMAAAAKAARKEMMDRIRENREGSGGRSGSNGRSGGNGGNSGNGGDRGNGGAKRDRPPQEPREQRASNPQQQRPRNGRNNAQGGATDNNVRNFPSGNGNRPQEQRQQQRQQAQHREQPVEPVDGDDRDEDRMPRNIDPLRTNLPSRRDMTGVKRMNGGGQPDPTRTSIDALGQGKQRGGGNRNRGNGGGNYGKPARFAR
jgi:ATP-dependent RNA helicase RhlE